MSKLRRATAARCQNEERQIIRAWQARLGRDWPRLAGLWNDGYGSVVLKNTAVVTAEPRWFSPVGALAYIPCVAVVSAAARTGTGGSFPTFSGGG